MSAQASYPGMTSERVNPYNSMIDDPLTGHNVQVHRSQQSIMQKPIGSGFVQGMAENPFSIDRFQHHGSAQIGGAAANNLFQQRPYRNMNAGLGFDFSVHKREKGNLVTDQEVSDTVMSCMTNSFSKYPAFSAEYATYNAAESAHESTAHEFASRTSTSSQVPSNVQMALADLYEKTGFSIVPDPKPAHNIEDLHNSSRHMGVDHKGGNLATDIEEDRFNRHHLGPIAGFTPLVKQLEDFVHFPPRKVKYPEPESASDYHDNDTDADASDSETDVDSDADTDIIDVVHQHNAYNTPVRPLCYRNAKHPKEFPKFKKLPHELQLIIWTFALPGPRTIELYCKRYDFSIAEHVALYPVCYSPPGMLYACSLSRRLALKQMSLQFSNPLSLSTGVFFSPATDTLRVDISSGQDLAYVTDASIRASRALVQHIELVFYNNHTIEMYESIADLVLRAPYCSWPAVETWRFPGVDEEDDQSEEVSFAEVEFNRTEDLDHDQAALLEKRELLARFIDEAVKREQHIVDEDTRIGVFIRYI